MERPPIPRSVKPRRPHKGQLPLIVVTPDEIFTEPSGELHDRDQLGPIIAEHPSAIVACGNPESLLAELHERFKADPHWQFRVQPIIRERWRPDGPADELAELLVGLFGFKRRHGRERGRYFYPLAPAQFCRQSARDLMDDGRPYWELLREWAGSVRAFCAEYELRPTPTQGGLAAQLLRHPSFYPRPRRKVPRATNEKARPALPGNHYYLNAEPGRVYPAAFYIDQHNAHHYAAQTIDVPQADRLRAHGYFDEPAECKPWARPGSRVFEKVTSQHGLLRLRLEVPAQLAATPFMPAAVGVKTSAGERDVWVFSNELPELLDLGARVRWLSAAWVSPEPDHALRRYAEWSQRRIKERPDQAPWLKGTLLSAYGILAARPRPLHFNYWQAESGERERIRLAASMVDTWAKRTKKEHQSPIANVIQRGMIEAETRRLSVALARDLTAGGHEVFSIYADAVLVRARGRQGATRLPLLPPPWRVKRELSMLRFHSPQAFESVEVVRLPGVQRAKIRYEQ